MSSSSDEKRRGPGRPRNDEDLESDLDRLLRDAGPDDVIQFSRGDANGDWRYLEQQEPAKLLELGIREWAAQRYGGGKIRARIRNRRTSQYGPARSFTLEGAPRQFSRETQESSSSAAAGTGTAAGSSGAMGVAEKIALAMAVPFATAAGSFLAKKLLEGPKSDPLLAQLLALVSDPRRKGTELDPLELQKLLQAAEDRGEKRGRELGELRAQAEAPATPIAIDAGDGWGAVLNNILPALQTLGDRYLQLEEKRLERIPPRLAVVQGGLPATSATPAASASSSAAAPTSESSSDASSSSSSPTVPPGIDPSDPLTQLLGSIPVPARRFMLAAAQAGEDPLAYVPLILGKLDDRAFQTLAENIDRPDLLDVAFRVVPKWAEYRQFFADLFAGIRSAIESAAEDDAAESSSSSSEAPAA